MPLERRSLTVARFVGFTAVLCFAEGSVRSDELRRYTDPDTGLIWFDDLDAHHEQLPFLVYPQREPEASGGVAPPGPPQSDRIITFDRPEFHGGTGGFEPGVEILSCRLTSSEGYIFIENELISSSAPDNGTDHLRLLGDEVLEIRRSAGGPFDLERMDVAEYRAPTATTITIRGYRDGSLVAYTTFRTDGVQDGSGPNEDFETIVFGTSFNNVDLVTVDGGVVGSVNLDNIHVYFEEVASSRAAPLPPLYAEYDFDGLPHRLNEISATGGPFAPESVTNDPLVVPSSGALTERPLRFGTTSLDQIRMSVSLGLETYGLEFDIAAPLLGSGPDEGFTVFLDGAGVNALRFLADGSIRFESSQRNYDGLVGTLPNDAKMRITCRIDIDSNLMSIALDSATPMNVPIGFFSDLRSIRFSMKGTGEAAIDNVKLFGYEEPSGIEMVAARAETSTTELSFPPVAPGERKSRQIRVSNTGEAPLSIEELNVAGPFRATTPLPVIVPGLSDTWIEIAFEPTAAGAYNSDIEIVSNSDEGAILINLDGRSFLSPELSAIPTRFEATLPPGAQWETNVSLRNTGSSLVRWSFANGSQMIDGSTAEAPGDPLFPSQWHLGDPFDGASSAIHATRAWLRTKGSGALVALVGTGADTQHEDLVANVWSNPGEIPANGIDDDNNGLVDDTTGWDFFHDDNDPDDEHGSGTHSAGVIGAAADNGLGGVGVAPEVEIVPVKFLGDSGAGFLSDAIEAIDYADSIGARVIHLDWYIPVSSSALGSAITRAATVVVAAGDLRLDLEMDPVYPAAGSQSNMIVVAALDRHGELSEFSNFGSTKVDIAAPGNGIAGPFPENTYGLRSSSGTAAAAVAGTACLGISASPLANDAVIRSGILNSAVPMESLEGKVASRRKVDALASIDRGHPTTWLSLGQGDYFVEPGTDAVVGFRIGSMSANLPLGVYHDEITILSDSPSAPVIRIPVELTISLDSGDPPFVSSQPEDVQIRAGESASLSVEFWWASELQWYEGESGDDSSPIAGATESTLDLPVQQSVGTRRFWVRATNAHGIVDSNAATLTIIPPIPDSPQNLSATYDTHPDRIELSWDAAANASTYRIHRGTSSSFASSTVIANDVDATAWSHHAVIPGVNYFYWVIAIGPGGESPPAGPAGGRARLDPPPIPNSISASDSTQSNGILVSWAASPRATSYQLYRATTPNFAEASLVRNGSGTSWLDSGTEIRQAYYYWVAASNSSGSSATVGPDEGRVLLSLTRPGNVTATSDLPGRIEVRWNVVLHATSYAVFRSDSANPRALLATTSDPVFVDESALDGVLYSYSVRASTIDTFEVQSPLSAETSGEAGFHSVDMTIGRSAGSQLGSGVVNTNGAGQTISVSNRRPTISRATALSTNRGNIPDSLLVRSSRGNRLISVSYFHHGTSTRNISASITTGGESFDDMGKEESITLSLRVSPTPSAKRSRRKTFRYTSWVSTSSLEDVSLVDRVNAKFLFRNKVPPRRRR